MQDLYSEGLDRFCGYLNQNEVKYMIVGGLAVNYHGFQRATGDVDIWYDPIPDNYEKLLKAIKAFGFETQDLEGQKFDEVKQVIILPLDSFSIELLSLIDGKFSFDSAFEAADSMIVIDQTAKVINYDFLVQNELMVRRPKDIEDVHQLEIRRPPQTKEK